MVDGRWSMVDGRWSHANLNTRYHSGSGHCALIAALPRSILGERLQAPRMTGSARKTNTVAVFGNTDDKTGGMGVFWLIGEGNTKQCMRALI
jgi:hypothetical protein